MSPGINLAPRPTLLSHHEALDALWHAVRLAGSGPGESRSFRKIYPREGGWRWVTGGGAEPVADPSVTAWLDARWAVVERVYYAQPWLLPHVVVGGEGSPRPAEGWEWSCIGLHRLWEGWSAEDGMVRADLRPAIFAFDGSEEFDRERLAKLELLYPRDRLEGLVRRLRGAAAPRHRGRHRWRDTVTAAVVRHRLCPSDGPSAVLERLEREAQARRRGRRVLVSVVGPGRGREVRTTTFDHVAARALSRGG